MEFIRLAIDFVLHVDEYLNTIIQNYGTWTYAVLFAVIFMETGLVVTPFLPGDSLLFAAGAFASKGSLNVWLLWLLLFTAAVIGDTVNYWAGHYFGIGIFERDSRILKKEYLERTEAFYVKHGGKTIVLARFVPIVRTFAPFVAGVGAMNYGKFIWFNVFGAFIWTGIFLLLGYFFGGFPIVEDNFELVIPAIILISVLPMVYEFLKARSEKRQQTSEGAA